MSVPVPRYRNKPPSTAIAPLPSERLCSISNTPPCTQVPTSWVLVPVIRIVPAPVFMIWPLPAPPFLSNKLGNTSRSTSWDPSATLKVTLPSMARLAPAVTAVTRAVVLLDRTLKFMVCVGFWPPPNFNSPPFMFSVKVPPPQKWLLISAPPTVPPLMFRVFTETPLSQPKEWLPL